MEQGKMWAEAVSQAAVAAEMLAAGYVLYRFFRPFAEKKKGALAAGTAYSVAMLVLYILPKNFSRFSAYGMGILAALAVFSRLDRKRYGQKVFLAAVFFPCAGLPGVRQRSYTISCIIWPRSPGLCWITRTCGCRCMR